MSRLTERLAGLKARQQKALALFLTAGYPQAGTLPDLAPGLEEAGADILEIGMPFSDPLADGPVIQESSQVAIANGTTLEGVLENVRQVRKRTSLPLVLMGYVNPILRYGIERFAADASSAGVDGLILPEMPLEEGEEFACKMTEAGMARILLVTPTTATERARAIDDAASGFVYCVSTTGVTGSRTGTLDHVRRLRQVVTRNPMLVGFGVDSAEHAMLLSRDADGVIIGSALIRRLRDGLPPAEVFAWVRSISSVLHSS